MVIFPLKYPQTERDLSGCKHTSNTQRKENKKEARVQIIVSLTKSAVTPNCLERRRLDLPPVLSSFWRVSEEDKIGNLVKRAVLACKFDTKHIISSYMTEQQQFKVNHVKITMHRVNE